MKPTRWNQCHVLSRGPERWHLWRFQQGKTGPVLDTETGGDAETAIPARWATRSFRHLWQPMLNVAWLPPHQVFLRVIEVPAADPAEVPAMVEFELERLSPLPVADVVWTCEVLPHVADYALRTVIVVMAARPAVEAWLGQLEQAGFLPDRLELPQVRALRSLSPEPDSVWILLEPAGESVSCVHAWWAKGRLRHLELRQFKDGADLSERLVSNLVQTAWAGEVEGWCGPGTRWRLVTEPTLVPALTAAFGEASTPVDVRPPLPAGELAVRSAAADDAGNLIPTETRARYRQQFVDRLWMRALTGVAMVYVLGVLGFFAALNIQDFRKMRIDDQVALLYSSYTNALALKAREEVLTDQMNLRFAALDCLKAASDALPADMTLTSFSFQRGYRLNLFGTVPTELQERVAEFNQALAESTVGDRPLFTQVNTKAIQAMPNRPANWTIECEFRRPDAR